MDKSEVGELEAARWRNLYTARLPHLIVVEILMGSGPFETQSVRSPRAKNAYAKVHACRPLGHDARGPDRWRVKCPRGEQRIEWSVRPWAHMPDINMCAED